MCVVLPYILSRIHATAIVATMLIQRMRQVSGHAGRGDQRLPLYL